MAQRRAPAAWQPAWARWVSRAIFVSGWAPRAHGAEQVPRNGPVLLAANHIAFVDGPLLQAMSPRAVHFLVKQEMFTGPMALALKGSGQISIDRSGDRGALLTAVDVLRRGGVVGVFPEGTRGRGDLTEVRAGVTWLALQTGTPVVPVAILGTRRTGESTSGLPPLRRRLDVVFGGPLHLQAPPGVPRRDALRAANETLRAAMDDHVMTAVARTGQQLPEDLGPGRDRTTSGEQQ